MKHIRRLLALVLAVATAAMMLAPAASAHQIPNTNAYYDVCVHLDGVNNSDALADLLHALHLFQGTSKGYELYRNMTRAEAAVMLVRFLGGEQEALAKRWPHPFTDVPAWASPYVGWLWHEKLAKGVSAKSFGAKRNVTLQQYALFLTRACEGAGVSDDAWKTSGLATEDEVELCDHENTNFDRCNAVFVSVRALMRAYAPGNGETVAQHLIDKGVFTAAELGEAAWNCLPSVYAAKDGVLTRQTAGVVVAECPEKNLVPAEGSADGAFDYLHAARAGADGINEFFTLDGKTLAVTARASWKSDAACAGLAYMATADGKDYLIERAADGVWGAVLAWDSKTLSVAADAKTLWAGSPASADAPCWKVSGTANTALANIYGLDGGVSLLVNGAKQFFYFGPKGSSVLPHDAGLELLGFAGSGIVVQQCGETATAISCLDAATGQTLDRYEAAQTEKDPKTGKTLLRRVDPDPRDASNPLYRSHYFFGEAGLYELTGGRLRRITARPVISWTTVRAGAGPSDPYILTHTTGKFLYDADGARCGDEIFLANADGTTQTLLAADSGSGLAINRLYDADSGSPFFTCRVAVKGGVDEYTYTFLYGIYTLSCKTERPGSAADLTEYQRERVFAERDRLKKLGLDHNP